MSGSRLQVRAARAVVVGGALLMACAPARTDQGATGATTRGTTDPTATTGATGPGGAATDPGRAPGPPFRVRTIELTFVDTTRRTEAGSQTPERPERRLVTTVRSPDAPGPFPLIVFSHGLSGHPDKFTKLLDRWAEAGFVVAAPAFPLTNDRVPGHAANWTGLAKQPGDVSFVIDRMVALAGDEAGPLFGRIDIERIGAGGLSLGGATTYAVTFNDCCRDPRVDAAEVLAGAPLAVGGPYNLARGVPLLIIHGDRDVALPYQAATEAYAAATAPKWFVTLLGGTHAPPFEDATTPYDDVVERTTTDFWRGLLAGDGSARARLAAEAAMPGLTTVVHEG